MVRVRRRQSASLFVRFDGSNLKPLNRTIFQIYKVLFQFLQTCWHLFGVGSLPAFTFGICWQHGPEAEKEEDIRLA